MKRSRKKKGLLAAWLLAVVALQVCVAGDGVILIAHEGLAVEAVSEEEVKRLFLGTSTRLNGARVTLATLDDGATHEAFLESWVSKTPQQFISHWRKIVFSGKGKMPANQSSMQDMLDYVAATEGAIGYVSASTRPVGVRVIDVR